MNVKAPSILGKYHVQYYMYLCTVGMTRTRNVEMTNEKLETEVVIILPTSECMYIYSTQTHPIFLPNVYHGLVQIYTMGARPLNQ